VLLFLNNDTEVITPGWIEAMLDTPSNPRSVRWAPGSSTAGTSQHEGIIMGPATAPPATSTTAATSRWATPSSTPRGDGGLHDDQDAFFTELGGSRSG